MTCPAVAPGVVGGWESGPGSWCSAPGQSHQVLWELADEGAAAGAKPGSRKDKASLSTCPPEPLAHSAPALGLAHCTTRVLATHRPRPPVRAQPCSGATPGRGVLSGVSTAEFSGPPADLRVCAGSLRGGKDVTGIVTAWRGQCWDGAQRRDRTPPGAEGGFLQEKVPEGGTEGWRGLSQAAPPLPPKSCPPPLSWGRQTDHHTRTSFTQGALT